MRKDTDKLSVIGRIIDANINRAKEGLRVCEEVVRFIANSRSLTAGFKRIRHGIDEAAKNLPAERLLSERMSLTDAGKDIHAGELARRGYKDIFFANIQRSKESVRVLEEFSKLQDAACALKFKKLRYRLYELEKKAACRLLSLRNHRPPGVERKTAC